MELTSAHLEAIKKAARAVEYGSVTIHISASARTLDLVVENRLKIEKEPDVPDTPKKPSKGIKRVCTRQRPGKPNSGTYGYV